MDLRQIASILPKQKEPVDWGEGNSLWAIARNKLIGLSTLEVYSSQAVDNELKLLIDMGIKDVAVPHIERIIKFLHKEGLEVPSILGRTSLKEIGKNTGEIKFLGDSEIAESIREILRLALYLHLRGIETSYRNDVLELIWDILQEDFQTFKETIALQKRKNWLLPPPEVPVEKNVSTEERMNWGEAVGLWSIARDKLVKMSLLEIYLSQASDPELKAYIESVINKTVVPVLERVNSLLHEEGHGMPSMFGRTYLHVIGRNTGNLNWMKDNEIAVFVREHLRLVLYVDFEALVDTVRSDLLDFVWGIFTGDLQRFRQIIELQRKNNWLLPSPSLRPEHQ